MSPRGRVSSRFSRATRVGVAAARAGGGLRRAAAGQPPTPDGGAGAGLTTRQTLLLARHIAARVVLGRLEMLFLAKYLLLLGGLALIVFDVLRPLGVALVVLFVLAAIGHWLVYRTLARIGAFRALAPAEEALGDATTVWWPNLRREFGRVGLPDRPRGVLRLGAAYATRRLTADQEQALAAVDWRAVAPGEQWQQARQVLARAAGPS